MCAYPGYRLKSRHRAVHWRRQRAIPTPTQSQQTRSASRSGTRRCLRVKLPPDTISMRRSACKRVGRSVGRPQMTIGFVLTKSNKFIPWPPLKNSQPRFSKSHGGALAGRPRWADRASFYGERSALNWRCRGLELTIPLRTRDSWQGLLRQARWRVTGVPARASSSISMLRRLARGIRYTELQETAD